MDVLTIQEVGTEILNNTPRGFYIFSGSEYGIKKKYIETLTQYYGTCKESYSINQLLNMMNTKHLVPLTPAVYVVRYDEEFLSSLTDKTAKHIASTKIIGTIVGIYDPSIKGVSKLSKYLDAFTVEINSVNKNFIMKYLHSDFPSLPDRLISIAATYGLDYGDSQNICRSMSSVPPDSIFCLTDLQIAQMFGKQTSGSEAALRQGVAARSFSYLVTLLDEFSGEYDSIFYTILSTMIELDKLLSNSYAESDIKDYVKRWTREDVYNMFMNTYEEIRKLRSYATDGYTSVIYLFGLLNFSTIPDVEAMS